jgi:hypothetical protein
VPTALNMRGISEDTIHQMQNNKNMETEDVARTEK